METSPLRPARFRRISAPRDIDSLLDEISRLVAERQRLRAGEAAAGRLERNRLKIARAQWELSYALIRRYGVDAAAEAAA